MATDGQAVRWGVLSTASIARYKVIPGFRRAERTRVIAIGSRDVSRAKLVARELGIPRVHGSYEELLADPEIDAVYIPEPSASRVDDRGGPGRQARALREAVGHDQR